MKALFLRSINRHRKENAMARTLSRTPSSKTLAPSRARATRTARSRSATAADSAAPALSESQIKSILRFHSKNLSTSGAAVDDDTVFGSALSDLDIAGMSARVLFKALSRRDIVNNGGQDKPWPADWLTLSVATLAPQLVA